MTLQTPPVGSKWHEEEIAKTASVAASDTAAGATEGGDPNAALKAKGWEQHEDSGRVYYFNTISGDTTWDPPAGWMTDEALKALAPGGGVVAAEEAIAEIKGGSATEPVSKMSNLFTSKMGNLFAAVKGAEGAEPGQRIGSILRHGEKDSDDEEEEEGAESLGEMHLKEGIERGIARRRSTHLAAGVAEETSGKG